MLPGFQSITRIHISLFIKDPELHRYNRIKAMVDTVINDQVIKILKIRLMEILALMALQVAEKWTWTFWKAHSIYNSQGLNLQFEANKWHNWGIEKSLKMSMELKMLNFIKIMKYSEFFITLFHKYNI